MNSYLTSIALLIISLLFFICICLNMLIVLLITLLMHWQSLYTSILFIIYSHFKHIFYNFMICNFNDMLCDLYAMLSEIKMKGLIRLYAMLCYDMQWYLIRKASVYRIVLNISRWNDKKQNITTNLRCEDVFFKRKAFKTDFNSCSKLCYAIIRSDE